MAKQAVVTLLSDFGTADPYVGAMKGAILSACPRAQIIDICHDIPPQDVLAGAFVWAQAAPCFPPDTVHVGVVDPGVGTDRRILAGRFGGQVFLFPDNGLITFIAEALPIQEIVAVRNTALLPPAPSMTFHGRDIFAPLAGLVLNGLNIRKLGPQPDTYKTLDMPSPAEQDRALAGQVIHVDHFGNLISNISRELVAKKWPDPSRAHVLCGGLDVGGLVGTYEFAEAGKPLALINSMGLVEVAVNRGRACDVLRAGVGTAVQLVESPRPAK